MFKLTYIENNSIVTITHANHVVINNLYSTLMNAGYSCRLWDKQGHLIF
jgi:hypothetical protein